MFPHQHTTCLCCTTRSSGEVTLHSMNPEIIGEHSTGILKKQGPACEKKPPTSHFQTHVTTTICINLFKAGLVSLQHIFENTVHSVNLTDCRISSFIVHLHTHERKIFRFLPISYIHDQHFLLGGQFSYFLL